jgi:hypothetical protein
MTACKTIWKPTWIAADLHALLLVSSVGLVRPVALTTTANWVARALQQASAAVATMACEMAMK